MHRIRIVARASTAAVLVAVIAAALVPAYAAAATRPTTLNLTLGSNCLRGTASDDAVVELVWKDSDGHRKLRINVAAGPTGAWNYCSSQSDVLLERGDQIKATVDGNAHILVVPLLTAFGSRDLDVYKGRGPAGAYLKIICSFSDGFEPCMDTWKVRVSSQGKWSFRPGWDVGGNDTMVVQWKSPAGDKVFTIANTAYAVVRIGSPRFTGATRNGTVANFVLKRGPALDVKAMAHPMSSPLNGDFVGKFRNAQGNTVKVRAGDLITSDISSAIDWIVPDVVATADSSSGHITGHCPSDGWGVGVTVYRDGENIAGDSALFTDEGNFDFDFSDGSNLPFQAGDRVLVGCQINDADWVEKFFTAN